MPRRNQPEREISQQSGAGTVIINVVLLDFQPEGRFGYIQKSRRMFFHSGFLFHGFDNKSLLKSGQVVIQGIRLRKRKPFSRFGRGWGTMIVVSAD